MEIFFFFFFLRVGSELRSWCCEPGLDKDPVLDVRVEDVGLAAVVTSVLGVRPMGLMTKAAITNGQPNLHSNDKSPGLRGH